MDLIVIQSLLVFIAYLLGSVNSAIIVSQVLNLPDPRTSGSGNPGATNILRTGNKSAAAITLLGDILKGFIPVFATKFIIGNELAIAMVCLAALLGHMFPIYYKFQGGKGVATTLGVLIGVNWLLSLVWILGWLTIAILFKYSSLAALVATILVLIISWYWNFNVWTFSMLIIITALIFWRHHANIINLINGNENKLGGKINF